MDGLVLGQIRMVSCGGIKFYWHPVSLLIIAQVQRMLVYVQAVVSAALQQLTLKKKKKKRHVSLSRYLRAVNETNCTSSVQSRAPHTHSRWNTPACSKMAASDRRPHTFRTLEYAIKKYMVTLAVKTFNAFCCNYFCTLRLFDLPCKWEVFWHEKASPDELEHLHWEGTKEAAAVKLEHILIRYQEYHV